LCTEARNSSSSVLYYNIVYIVLGLLIPKSSQVLRVLTGSFSGTSTPFRTLFISLSRGWWQHYLILIIAQIRVGTSTTLGHNSLRSYPQFTTPHARARAYLTIELVKAKCQRLGLTFPSVTPVAGYGVFTGSFINDRESLNPSLVITRTCNKNCIKYLFKWKGYDKT
jgi:hypothetical protein